MKTLMTGLFFLLCFAVANAQSLSKQVGDAKFQIIKKTAEFLSTDRATFGNNAKNKCEGCENYNDVKKYAIDNKLTKVDDLVTELQTIEVDTSVNKSEASLRAFTNKVIDKITTGSNTKMARKQLPGYKDYTNNLNTIIVNIKTTRAEPATSVVDDKQTVTQKSESTATKPGDTAKKTKALNDTVAGEEVVPQASLMDKFMFWLPYIIAGILLIVLITVWRSGNDHKGTIKKQEGSKRELEKQVASLKKDYSEALLSIKKLEEEVKNKEIDLQATEARLRNAEKNKKNPEQISVLEQQPAIEKPAAKITVQKPKPVVANIKYARYADMGDGFSNAELLDKADDETIFELTITPNNMGEFKVANLAAAQHYALSNAQYFLGKTCQYNSFPSESATIQTDTPGTIKLNGNKWAIVSPAKISFS